MATNKKTILLAEDEKIIYENLIDQLKEEGLEAVLATDGKEALDKINAKRPDLILLDLIMPKLNGFDLLKILKENSETKNIPVIVLSNLGQESDIKECMELGAKDYLIKSDIIIEDIIKKIKKII